MFMASEDPIEGTPTANAAEEFLSGQRNKKMTPERSNSMETRRERERERVKGTV